MNGQTLKIGDKFEGYNIIKVYKIDNQTRYDTQCEKCGYIRENTVGFYVRKGKKCQFCSCLNWIGKKNGMLSFLKYLGNGKYEATCDCGVQCISETTRKSCGCLKVNGRSRLNINLERFRKLIGVRHKNICVTDVGIIENRCHLFVKCRCGKTFNLEPSDFFRYQSCGCRKYKNQARGSRQGNSLLNETKVASLREMFLTGLYSQKELSEIFETSIDNVDDIIKNKSWKHVKTDDDILKRSPVKDKTAPRTAEKIQIGKMYGNWKVLEKAQSKNKQCRFLCQCSCGIRSVVPASSLRRGVSKQCEKCHRFKFVHHLYKRSY